MASAYGNVVQRWQSYIEASITSQTDTTATITLKVYFHSISYGYKVRANASGTIDGNTSSTANFSATSGTGQTVNQLAVTHTVTVSKGSSARDVSVSGRVQLTGGFHNGTSTAYTTVSVPARTYYQPHPPKSFAAKRTSDTQMDLTWQGDYTGMDGGYPWAGVYVERRIDDGSWVSIATLNWDAVNYSDRTTAGNHKYEYRVQSYGPGGKSSYATANPLYTTPAAPASVSLVKTAGTEVSLDVDTSNAPYATSWDVQESLNGGEWSDVGNYATFPQTVDVGGGTAKLRVRSKLDSLLSGWTESAAIPTIVAPNAPTLTSKPDAVIATGSIVTVQWKPNHPDGSAQTQAQVEYTVGSSSPQTATVQGAVTSYRLPASATSSAGTVSVRVRTHGLDLDWGAWTSYYTFKVAVPPEAYFTTPGIDGAKIGDLPLVAEWRIADDSGVASQSLQLMDGSGKVLHSATPSTGARQYTFDASTYQLSNATDYSLRLTVRGGSSLTTTVVRSFSTSFAEPARPDAGVSVDPSDLSAAVTVYAGSPSSEAGEVIEVPATPGTLVPGFTVFGNTRQNLWVNPSGTRNGVTVTSNEDGTVTVSGTATASTYIYIPGNYIYTLAPGREYTVSLNKATTDGSLFRVFESDGTNSIANHIATEAGTTFTVKAETIRCQLAFVVESGTTVSGTYRVMLNEGSTAEPWCPPGLNGVDELSVVTAGKNLWEYPDSMSSGITATINEDGGITLSGTATTAAFAFKRIYDLLPGATYTISVDKTVEESRGVFINELDEEENSVGIHYAGGSNNASLTNTFTVNAAAKQFNIGFAYEAGSVASGTYYVMLELGTTATAYEPPAVTTTPIDLDGHSLNSLPDGTRDELRIDGTGAVTLVQRVGEVTVTGGMLTKNYTSNTAGCTIYGSVLDPPQVGNPMWEKDDIAMGNVLPPINSAFGVSATGFSGTNTYSPKSLYVNAPCSSATDYAGARSWLNSNPLTVLYKLATPQEVDLPGIAMPAFPAAETQVFCASNVPCEVRVDYPDTNSLSVTRVLADGSRWLVADGLTSGQQAIDPLPPLNADYAYEVTASTGAGAIVSASFAQRIDSRGRMALNFGAAASVAHVMGANAKVSYDESADGELYHFADGGESGGLPQFYGTGDIDASGSVSFELMDRGERDRFKRSARRYAVGWFRDAMGGRIRARMGYSESVKAGGIAVWEESVDMDEVIFEEAW